jgi:predicted membrane protein
LQRQPPKLSLKALSPWTRGSVTIALFLSTYFFYLPQNFASKIGHGEAVVVFVLLVLAASRCGDARAGG